MINYSDHEAVLRAFRDDMAADSDRRKKMREIENFLYAENGQWESKIWNRFSRRYRGTFDMCKPEVERIWSSMAKNDFDIRVKPAGSGADKKNAQRFDGVIRQVEELSGAPHEYKQAIRGGIEIGFDSLMASHRYVDSDSFDQNLVIQKVANPIDRLWFGYHERQTAEDAPHATLLGEVSATDGEKKYGRKIVSIGTENEADTWKSKRDNLVIGRIFYKKTESRTLYLLSDGRVIDDESILDEMREAGITVEHSRKRPKVTVVYREFDEKGWLDDEKPTPFKHLPFAPMRPNFKVHNGKVSSRGAVEPLMDQQRVMNYGMSRAVDDYALSAKEKLLVGSSQAKGREKEFTSYSTSDHEVQLYDDTSNSNPPIKVPANQGSAGLQQLLSLTERSMEKTAGTFGANPQNNTGLQSDVGLQRLENAAQESNIEYADAAQTAICHLAKILIGAVPNVHPEGSRVITRGEDGAIEEIVLGQRILDDETGEVKEVIDLHSGVYNVTCSIGATFANRRAEASDRLIKYAEVNPNILDMSQDVLLNNDDTPGMDVVAERVRLQMVMVGKIPETQLTEEEKQMLQGQERAQDPAELIGQAELLKAETEAESSVIDQEIKFAELDQKQQRLDFDKEKQSLELLLTQQSAIAKTLNDLSKAVENLQGSPLAAVPAQHIAEL
jgi:hypothetical protein